MEAGRIPYSVETTVETFSHIQMFRDDFVLLYVLFILQMNSITSVQAIYT